MRKTWAVPAGWLALMLLWCVPGHADEVPAQNVTPARVIVKFKSDPTAGDDTGPPNPRALVAGSGGEARAVRLGARAGLALAHGGKVAARTHVVTAQGVSSQALAERLSRDADVAYAVPDLVRHASAAPNDPLYRNRQGDMPAGPSGQWYLQAPDASRLAGINAPAAWDLLAGNSNTVVVAVLDTGVRPNHPDLKGAVAGTGLLQGIDMIQDDTRSGDAKAGDSNAQPGRDDDPSDPGDGLRAFEAGSGIFVGCEASPSSWHGTQTAGLLGALTDNGVGVASVGRQHLRVLPVRVLGKCGGWDSDIIAGMRWAAGLPVDGVRVNDHPARVINLSLGGQGSCTQAYEDAIREITAAGVVVVAAAGNFGTAVSSPANCPGVIAVGGLRHAGDKVGYSDLGPEVSLSAPAGNCVTSGASCEYPILSTTNAGAAGGIDPGADTYTNHTTDIAVGTSFSAPLVSGTAALMMARNTSLTPLQVRLLLQSSARPFPAASPSGTGEPAVPACTSALQGDDGEVMAQPQCLCSSGTCGAGMLDTGAAVLAAAQSSPVFAARARIDLSSQQPVAGAPLRLSAANSVADAGRQITSHQWTLVDGGGIVTVLQDASASAASVTPTGPGRFEVSLRVQDDAGTSSTTTLTVRVAAAPTVAPPATAAAGGGGGATGGLWQAGLLCATLALLALRRRAQRVGHSTRP